MEEAITRRRLLGATAGGAVLGALPGTVTAEPDDQLHFLAWNTWLLEPVELFGYVPYAKPQMDERAREIGDALDELDYDVMALCEVFDEDDRETIRERQSGQIDDAAGPPETWRKVSGGVHTLVRDREIVRWTAEAFEDNGELTGDADAWSNKGVLYTEIDLGVGAIDLFSTHMFAGDDGADPVETRASQLAQLGDMIDRFGKVENVTVVSGDLNIDGTGPEYEQTVEPFLDAHGLVDLWPALRDTPGGTGRSGIENNCDVDPDDGLPYYCRGQGDAPDDTSRIDYVIVEEQTEYHELVLTATAIERATFWRGKVDPDQFFADEDETVPNYLSDHIGVDVQFDVHSVEPTAEPPEDRDLELPDPEATPGFGLAGTAAGLGTAAYLYSRWGDDDK